MERFTYKDASGNWVIACNRFWNFLKLKFPAHVKGEAVDRLAAYEETGVEPSDVITAPNMAKIACALHELNQYKELGDIDRLREIMNACNLIGKKVYINKWWHGGIRIDNPPIERTVHNVLIAQSEGALLQFKDGSSHTCLLGKTVFLTREDAEAALEGETGE